MKITIDLDTASVAILRRHCRASKRPLEDHARVILTQAIRREEAAEKRLATAARRTEAARLQ